MSGDLGESQVRLRGEGGRLRTSIATKYHDSSLATKSQACLEGTAVPPAGKEAQSQINP